MTLKSLIFVAALALTAWAATSARAADEEVIHDPTLIPNCQGIGGELIIMAPGLYACCFDTGCWICDAAGECSFDPAYSVPPSRGNDILWNPDRGYVQDPDRPRRPWQSPLPDFADRVFDPVDLPDFAPPAGGGAPLDAVTLPRVD